MIRKAVIPAAGFGTRFLPPTKAMPKEMLPIVDTPVIQLVVEEAVKSGIRDILIITGKGKRALEEHFDRNVELEAELRAKEKTEFLREIRRISGLAEIFYVRQKELNGLGDAVLHAERHVGNEPFAVLLGDTIIDAGGRPMTEQLVRVFRRYGKSVIGLEKVAPDKVSRYGIAGGDRVEKDLIRIRALVEKPAPKKAPGDLAIAGRYVLTPDVFSRIRRVRRDRGGEIQLTNAIRMLMDAEPVYGLRFHGKRYDIGSKLDFLKTNVEFALKREDFGKEFRRYLAGLMNQRRR